MTRLRRWYLIVSLSGTLLFGAATPSTAQEAFSDDFDGPPLNEKWSSFSATPPTVSSEAGKTSNGMRVASNGTIPIFARKDIIGQTTDDQWVFEFDFRILEDATHPLEMPNGSIVPIFTAKTLSNPPSGIPPVVLQIFDASSASGEEDLRWRLRVQPDQGDPLTTPNNTSAPRVKVNEWQHVKLVHTPAGPGASDGTLELLLDGATCSVLEFTGLETDAQNQLFELRLGLTSAPSATFEADLHFDNFVAENPTLESPATTGSDGLLYRVTFWENGDPEQTSTVEGTVDRLNAGPTSHPQGEVTAWSEAGADGELRYFIDVEPSTGYGVFEVEYPLLVLNPLAGAQERLVVPHGFGRTLEGDLFDPQSTPESFQGAYPRGKLSLWYGTYGSKTQAMQLVLYENDTEGVMLWTPDPGLQIKDFEISRDSVCPGVLRAAVHHFPGNTGQPGTAWSASYPVAVRPYAGGWHTAAKIYRQWAIAQSWTSEGPLLARIERGNLPYWYRNNALWIGAIDEFQLDLVDALREIFPGVELGVHLGGWQKNSTQGQILDVRLPEYLPPNADADNPCPECWYFEYVDREEQGMHVFPYVNAHIASIVSETDPTPVVPTLTLTSPQPSLQTADLLSEPPPAALDWSPYYQPTNQHPMCRASTGWKDYFVDLLSRNLKPFDEGSFEAEFGGYGLDGHYLDQMASGALFPCFANDHGHAPGFGSHHFEGVLEMADRVRTRYPNKILYGEGIFEGYVDSIQESYSIEPSFFHGETLVPLFAAVYHGYTSLHEWPVYVKSQGLHVPSFAAALAAAVHLGHKVGSFQSLVTWDALVEGAGYPTRVGQCEDSPASNQTACGYLQDLVQMKFQTMDVLDYGERLRDPTTDSPTHTVSWYHSSAFPEPPSNHVRPVIEASLWASLTTPERKLLLLSNSSETAQTVQVTAADLDPGVVLTDLAGVSWTYQPGASISVPPLSWRALRVLADTDGDGVLDEQDNCRNDPNVSQADLDGDGIGDACDNCVDTDNGPLALDLGGFSQRDTNADGYGNVCDADLDDDMDVDGEDHATWSTIAANPNDPRHLHADFDGDGDVDAGDESILLAVIDSDGDGVRDVSDNCPTISNPTQSDGDSDGAGDACDCTGNTGLLNPSAQQAVTGNGFEVDPTGAFADGPPRAENHGGPGEEHQYHAYGVNIPSICTVKGIEVRLDWHIDNAGGNNNLSIQLSWDGGANWTTAKTDPNDTETEHTTILGSPADTWGRSWTPSELSDANFRVKVRSNGASSRDYFLDWVPIRITYEP